MIEQSKKDPRNCNGTSEGYKGDHVKLAGGRYNPDNPEEVSLLGGKQGEQGMFFGRPYQSGSWQDNLCEAYAGPHDYVSSWSYNSVTGNIKTGWSSWIVGFREAASWVNVLTVTPFVLAGEAPAYMPQGGMFR
jgi:hypothetical protein